MSDVIDDHTGDVQVGASADVPVLSGSIDDLSQHSTHGHLDCVLEAVVRTWSLHG